MYCILYLFRPDLIDYDALHPENHLGNLNNAFQVASSELGIPQILDAEGNVFFPHTYNYSLCSL